MSKTYKDGDRNRDKRVHKAEKGNKRANNQSRLIREWERDVTIDRSDLTDWRDEPELLNE